MGYDDGEGELRAVVSDQWLVLDLCKLTGNI